MDDDTTATETTFPRTRVTRVCAGEYEVTELGNTIRPRRVRVTRVDGEGWVAAAAWDQLLYTDYLPTKRDAVHNARLMIEEGRS